MTVTERTKPLRTAEAARALGCSEATIKRYAAKGVLTPSRHAVNGFRLFDAEQIQELARSLGQGK
jgi:DNA-binding transcriptional MerR regulator